MEEIQKFCREHYAEVIKSNDKVKWLNCLQHIDSIAQMHINTKYFDFWNNVEKYMKDKYNLLFKK